MATSIYYIPLFFQFTKGDSALEAAVRLLPFIILFVSFVVFAGGLLPVFGRYAPWYFPASVLMTVGGAFMYRVKSTTHIAAIYGFEVLIAVGVGLIFQTATVSQRPRSTSSMSRPPLASSTLRRSGLSPLHSPFLALFSKT